MIIQNLGDKMKPKNLKYIETRSKSWFRSRYEYWSWSSSLLSWSWSQSNLKPESWIKSKLYPKLWK